MCVCAIGVGGCCALAFLAAPLAALAAAFASALTVAAAAAASAAEGGKGTRVRGKGRNPGVEGGGG